MKWKINSPSPVTAPVIRLKSRDAQFKNSSYYSAMEMPTYAELHEMVRVCLWRDWDPIGVNHFDEASDEYDSYVPTITQLLLDGVDADKLRCHLRTIETNSMGLSPFHPTTDSTVKKLLAMVER